jgi:hypothetical protein
MKKILVILMMVLLCSTAVIGQTKKRSTKKQTNRVRTESKFERDQREAKEFIDLQKRLCLLFYGEIDKIDRLKIELAKENAAKDFRITKFGVDTVYGNGVEYVINVKRDGTIDTLSSHDWVLETDIAMRHQEIEIEERELMRDIERETKKMEEFNKWAERELEKSDEFLRQYSFSLFESSYSKIKDISWRYEPNNASELNEADLLEKLSIWWHQETGETLKFNTSKIGKKFAELRVNFKDGSETKLTIYKCVKQKDVIKAENLINNKTNDYYVILKEKCESWMTVEFFMLMRDDVILLSSEEPSIEDIITAIKKEKGYEKKELLTHRTSKTEWEPCYNVKVCKNGQTIDELNFYRTK